MDARVGTVGQPDRKYKARAISRTAGRGSGTVVLAEGVEH